MLTAKDTADMAPEVCDEIDPKALGAQVEIKDGRLTTGFRKLVRELVDTPPVQAGRDQGHARASGQDETDEWFWIPGR